MKIHFTNDLPTTATTTTTAFVDCGGAPIINIDKKFFVFDHHCDGRFALYSACGQVYLSLLQGLDTSSIEDVYVNHTDADSVIGVWLLTHPERVRQYKALLWSLVEQVSRVDNSGPAAALPGEALKGVHFALVPERGEKDSEAVFLECLAKCEAMCLDGTLFEDAPERPNRPGLARAFDRDGEVYPVHGDSPAFEDVYALKGMGLIYGDQNMVTIGKLPFFPCRSFKDGLIDRLNEAEAAKGGDGKWGGADSIMGSPRPHGTILQQQDVVVIVSEFIAG